MAFTKKAERTKANLLDSAQRLISAHGFDNVSVEDITKDSGVAKGTFYHYFECKEDVVRELSRNTAMATIERAIAHEGDVIERCCFYFSEIYKDCMWSGVRIVRQWLRDSVENKHAHPEKILSTHQGEGKGELRSDVPKTILCRILVSHFIGVITVWCMLNASFDLAKDSENYLKLDIENLLGPYVEK